MTIEGSAPPAADRLGDLLQAAVADAVISAEQAAELLRRSGTAEDAGQLQGEPGSTARGLVAEALGYVGAALAVVAGLLLTPQFWSDLQSWAHAAILAVVAVSLFVAGQVVTSHEPGPARRLSSFLWLLSVVAVAGTAGIVFNEIVAVDRDLVALGMALPTAAWAGVLWRWRPRALQELATGVAVIATGIGLLGAIDPSLVDFSGLLIWAIGVAWLLLAWGNVVAPVAPAWVFGGVAALFGPLVIFEVIRWESLLGLATAGGLVAAGVLWRRTVVLGLGVAGVFVYVPTTVFSFFGEALGAPLALLVVGVVLVAGSVRLLRLRSGLTADPATPIEPTEPHGD